MNGQTLRRPHTLINWCSSFSCKLSRTPKKWAKGLTFQEHHEGPVDILHLWTTWPPSSKTSPGPWKEWQSLWFGGSIVNGLQKLVLSLFKLLFNLNLRVGATVIEKNYTLTKSKINIPHMWLTYLNDAVPKYFYNNLELIFLIMILLNSLPYLPIEISQDC